MAHQVRAEGVERIAWSAMSRRNTGVALPHGVTIHMRDDLTLSKKSFGRLRAFLSLFTTRPVPQKSAAAANGA